MPNNRRFNPETNHYDYYFPMQLIDDADREYARFCGFEIGMARLGYRNYLAVFVPCRDIVIDAAGKEVFIETPEEKQHHRYLELIKDELIAQDAVKKDGRCMIANSCGGIRRCPARIPNPGYIPGGDQPKTLPVKCEGCKYNQFKQEHTCIPLSCLDHENEYGEMESYDVPAPDTYFSADRYDRLAAGFVEFVRQKKPEYADLAYLLTQEYNRSEAARELGIPNNTAAYHREKLKQMCRKYLDTTISA